MNKHHFGVKPPRARIGGLIHITPVQNGGFAISAKIDGKLFKEGSKWVSYCKALDLSTCGDTRAEAIENTKEAIRLFLEVCIEKNTLIPTLASLGWNLAKGTEKKAITPRIHLPIQKDVPPAFMIESVKGKHWKGQITL